MRNINSRTGKYFRLEPFYGELTGTIEAIPMKSIYRPVAARRASAW